MKTELLDRVNLSVNHNMTVQLGSTPTKTARNQDIRYNETDFFGLLLFLECRDEDDANQV